MGRTTLREVEKLASKSEKWAEILDKMMVDMNTSEKEPPKSEDELRKEGIEKLYSMKLHEGAKIWAGKELIWIDRVPGGWIYFNTKGNVFVPFNNDDNPETVQL